MSLFNLFTKFNISEDDILSLDEKAILRLEKKIKAEIRLSEKYNQNDAINFIDLLKNNKKELTIFYADELTVLRQIIRNPSEIITEKIDVEIPEEFATENFKGFIEKYVIEDLRLYVNNCFKEDYYNALYYLLNFSSLFSITILEEIQKKLGEKLNFAVESIKVSTTNLYLKLDFCVNPFLYRTLSRIGAIEFEEEIILLTQTYAIETKYLEMRVCFLFALGSFNASSESMADYIRQVHTTTSLYVGIEEVEFNPRTKRKTGTSVLNLDKKVKKPQYTKNTKKDYTNYYTLYERKKPLIVLFGFIVITIVLLLLNWYTLKNG